MSNTTNQTLEDISIQFIQSIWTSALVAGIVESIDFVLCCFGLYILCKFDVFRTKPFIIVRGQFYNDLITNFYNAYYMVYHVLDIVRHTSEVMPRKSCFYVTCWQVFLIFNTQTLDMIMAVNRFLSVYDPVKFKNTSKQAYKNVVIGSYLFSAGVLMLAFFDKFDNTILIYCSLRVSLGEVAQLGFWFLLIAVNVMTLVTYGAMGIVSKSKVGNFHI